MISNLVSKTLLLPLKSRALATTTHPGLGFQDPISQQVWEHIGEEFPEGEDFAFIQSITERTKLFDRIVQKHCNTYNNTLVIHLGAGLCTRYLRRESTQNTLWYHVDHKEVIDLRESYLPNRNQKSIAFDITDENELKIFLTNINEEKHSSVLFVAEGLTYYFDHDQLKKMFASIEEWTEHSNSEVSFCFDYVHQKYPFRNLIPYEDGYFENVGFKSGFASPNELLQLFEKPYSYQVYKLPFEHFFDDKYKRFLVENSGEIPYEIMQVNFSELVGLHKTNYRYERNYLKWNSAFSLNYLKNGQVFFLSEDSFYLFSVEEISTALFYLQDPRSFQTTISEIQAIYIIEKLMGLNLLINTKDDKRLYTPSISFIKTEHGATVKEWKEETLLAKLTSICQTSDVRFIITHDFLYQEIKKDLEHQLSLGYKIFIVCLHSHRVLLSPVFEKTEQVSVFFASLSQNNPHRRWAESMTEKEIFIPCPLKLDVSEEFESRVINSIVIHLEDSQNSTVLIEVRKFGEMISHQLINYDLLEDTLPPSDEKEEIVEVSSGYRTKRAQEVLIKLEPYLSDVIGCVSTPELKSDLGKESFTYMSTYPQEGNLVNGFVPQFFQNSIGKGLEKVQSKISAIAEGIERFSMDCNDQESLFFSIYKTRNDQINPLSVFMFSEKQYETSKEFVPFSFEEEIPWTKGYSLTEQKEKLLPAEMCFRNIKLDRSRYFRSSSNGCASGSTIKEAILQGIFELVERDAVAKWWYQKKETFSVPLDDHLELVTLLEKEGWKTWILDVTNDLDIPVMVAVGRSETTNEFRLGFGAHLDAKIAVTRAISELHQIIEVAEHSKADFDFSRIKPEAYLFSKKETMLPTSPEVETIDQALKISIDRIQERGFEVLYKNLSRSNLALKTVKVFVPGLCFIWPEFGNPRLFQNSLGETILNEEDLNELPLFV